jgi:hypothetical protein
MLSVAIRSRNSKLLRLKVFTILLPEHMQVNHVVMLAAEKGYSMTNVISQPYHLRQILVAPAAMCYL